ncbi:GL16848 [Drosophila persimilis]|uniref:GL16848 n=1 Tax=Drosophila persimilis TaxID=7234 RepID=B4GHZ8_DROPE|nr:GL16848 [Drosophila persimilis]
MGSRIKNDVKKLFEFWCEIKPTPGLERGTSPRNGAAATPAGVIVESFPEGFRDKEVLAGIPSFAFPCDLESDSVHSYSFVHTTGDSKWPFWLLSTRSQGENCDGSDHLLAVARYLPETVARAGGAEANRCEWLQDVPVGGLQSWSARFGRQSDGLL